MNNKVGILTINDYSNFGNRLQNYALSKKIEKLGKDVKTIHNITGVKSSKMKKICKFIFKKIMIYKNIERKRYETFVGFEKQNIAVFKKEIYNQSKNLNRINNFFEFFIIGSDQVWNPYFGRISEIDFALFAPKSKVNSYSASFGIDKIEENMKWFYKEGLNNIKNISVREERGKEIVEELTGRTDVEVLVDPTMLLTAEEWDKVSKRPEKLQAKKYILNYFLGDVSDVRKKEIERIAKENDCEIINILDPNDPLYVSGPSEFLWLEKNAFLICTDSFHSSVFAILYNRPFIVFDREQAGMENIGSRIDTLINKFKLKNRRFEGKITKENLEYDYTEAYKILEEERKKSDKFLRKALEIEENEN